VPVGRRLRAAPSSWSAAPAAACRSRRRRTAAALVRLEYDAGELVGDLAWEGLELEREGAARHVRAHHLRGAGDRVARAAGR
jgi:hypothetical protein